MKELDRSWFDHDSHQSPSDQFKAATIPALKVIFTQEQVEQMLKLASEGVKVTFEKSRGRKGNLKRKRKSMIRPDPWELTPMCPRPLRLDEGGDGKNDDPIFPEKRSD